ncbi:MAG: sporulation protein YabP [Eubacteriales bacterium]
MKTMDKELAEHHILLESRKSLTISGVEEVESFDENNITMYTNQGVLVVTGEGLHIEKLSLDGGDLKVEGQVDSLSYEENLPRGSNFFSRLFG